MLVITSKLENLSTGAEESADAAVGIVYFSINSSRLSTEERPTLHSTDLTIETPHFTL